MTVVEVQALTQDWMFDVAAMPLIKMHKLWSESAGTRYGLVWKDCFQSSSGLQGTEVIAQLRNFQSESKLCLLRGVFLASARAR